MHGTLYLILYLDMNICYLQLGSNLGDRKSMLMKALSLIEGIVGNVIVASGIYESSPWGVKEQSDFLNQVLKVQTTLSPHDLLEKILNIEKIIGRKRIKKWGERLIDIDILFYNNNVIHSQRLVVPHPYLHKRRFVLLPLDEIASDYLHPQCHKKISRLLIECDDMEKVGKYVL